MSNKSPTIAWQREVGLNHVGAYQVSGEPFVTGNLDTTTTDGICIKFPYVTRWISVINNSTTESCRVGFSQNGVLKTDKYFTVDHQNGAPGYSNSFRSYELKVSEIWLSGSSNIDIVAGLTSIPAGKTSGSAGPSWSGSLGVG